MNTSLDRYFPFGLANTAGFDTVDNILAVRIHNESKNDRHDPYYRLRTCILGKETRVEVILIITGHLHCISLEPDSPSLPKTLGLYPSLCLLLFIQNISTILIGSRSRAYSSYQQHLTNWGEDKTWTRGPWTPSVWTRSMDHFHGPGPWTPCH